jgi:hypothetical protein
LARSRPPPLLIDFFCDDFNMVRIDAHAETALVVAVVVRRADLAA